MTSRKDMYCLNICKFEGEISSWKFQSKVGSILGRKECTQHVLLHDLWFPTWQASYRALTTTLVKIPGSRHSSKFRLRGQIALH
eukprot:1161145-Pelagomonas_calceolata.AAC.11